MRRPRNSAVTPVARLRGRRGLRTLAMLVGFLTTPALAVEPDEILADPALEARAREIGRIIRCVVCQSETIEDSNAPLARDLRLLVRERLVAGDADEEVVAFLVDRYGDYVLLKPRARITTLLLWGAPLLAGAVGAAGLVLTLRGARRRDASADPLSDEEAESLRRLT